MLVQEEIRSLHAAEGSSAPALRQSSASVGASATLEHFCGNAAKAAAAESQGGTGWGGPAAGKQPQQARHAAAMPASSAAPAGAAVPSLQKPGRLPARGLAAVLAAQGPGMGAAALQRRGAELREPEPEATHEARPASSPGSLPPAKPRQPAQSSGHGSPGKQPALGTAGQAGACSTAEAPRVAPALLDTLDLLEPLEVAAEDLLGDRECSERQALSPPGRASETGQSSRRSSPASKLAAQIPPHSPVRAHLAAQQVCVTLHKELEPRVCLEGSYAEVATSALQNEDLMLSSGRHLIGTPILVMPLKCCSMRVGMWHIPHLACL